MENTDVKKVYDAIDKCVKEYVKREKQKLIDEIDNITLVRQHRVLAENLFTQRLGMVAMKVQAQDQNQVLDIIYRNDMQRYIFLEDRLKDWNLIGEIIAACEEKHIM